jgi:hypothetical protein
MTTLATLLSFFSGDGVLDTTFRFGDADLSLIGEFADLDERTGDDADADEPAINGLDGIGTMDKFGLGLRFSGALGCSGTTERLPVSWPWIKLLFTPLLPILL